MEINQIYNRECLEAMKEVEDNSIDAIICDPPYGTTGCKWDSVIDFELMWLQLNRIIKPSGAIVLFGSEPFSSALRMSNIKNYKYDWIWNKVNSGHQLNAKKQPMRVVENIMIFNSKIYYPIMHDNGIEKAKQRLAKLSNRTDFKKNEAVGNYNHQTKDMYKLDDIRYSYPKNIIKINKSEKECNSLHRLHPTQKPIALMEYLIKTYTNENEIVLDFTIGSGSTMVAAVNTKRQYIGFELDKTYFDIAEKRIFEAKQQLRLF